MSYSIKTTRKLFCKVCQDAGKPESEYTTHSVRSKPDRNGNTTVTCPILLQTECRFCYTKGHTAKYCPAISANNKDRRGNTRVFTEIQTPTKEPKKSNREPIKLPTTVNKVFPSFAALDNLDSDDEDQVIVEAQPAPKRQPTWADIANLANKEKIMPQTDPYENYTLFTPDIVYKKPKLETPEQPKQPRKRASEINWADCESSDDEDY